MAGTQTSQKPSAQRPAERDFIDPIGDGLRPAETMQVCWPPSRGDRVLSTVMQTREDSPRFWLQLSSLFASWEIINPAPLKSSGLKQQRRSQPAV